MKLRKSMLSASIATALLFAAAAQAAAPQQDSAQTANQQQGAQSAPGTEAQPQTLETVQVVGFRASLMKSLDVKRAANSIVDAVSAEDIGKFPNTNVAETMTLMPGVTIDRRFGQGGRVSVNGVDPNLNLSFLDGNPIASVDWLFGATPDRGFDYAILAPDIVGNIEVYKTSQARLPSGSLGGTVMINSRKPLDMPANTVAVSVGGVYNDLAKKGKPNASLTYSWKNAANNFGFDIAASHYEESINRQGHEIFTFSQLDAPKYATNPVIQNALASGQASPNAWLPDEVNAANFQQTRKRDSVLFNVQWKPTQRLSFLLGGLYVRENFDNFNQSMYGFYGNQPNNITALTANGGAVTSVDVCGAGQTNALGQACNNAGMTFDNNARAATIRTKALHLDGAYDGNDWGVSGKVGISTAHVNQQQWFLEPTYLGGYSSTFNGGYTFDDPSAALDPANWGSWNGPGNTSGFKGNYTQEPFAAKTTYGQVDFHVDFDSPFNRLEFGGRYVDDYHHTSESIWSGGITGFTLADLGDMTYPSIMQGSGFADVSADMKQHLAPTRSEVVDWVSNSPDLFSPGIYGPTYIQNTWNLRQKTEAAYLQQDFDFGNGLRGNIGVRYVRNKFTSHSYVPPGGSSLFVDIPDGIPPDWWQEQQNTNNKVLPSFNLVYDTGDNVVLRASAAKVIAWAPYNQMVGNLFLNTTVLTGSGGNANLKPYSAYVYQGSVEWYFKPQAVFAVTPFYYHILNYLSTIVSPEQQFNGESTTDPTDFANKVAQGLCDAETSMCTFQITRPGSIGAGAIKGMSVSYQQSFDNGFGLIANYTYADGTTQIGQELPFNSKHSVTLSPFYEKHGLLARLDYNWRSAYIAGGYVAGAPPAKVANYTELDATVGYTFNKHWSADVSALNLLNEAYKMSVPLAGLGDSIVNKYINGRRYMATVHFKWQPPEAAPQPQPAAPPPAPPAAPPPPPPQKVVIDLRGVNFKFDRPKPGEHDIGPTLMAPSADSLAILNQAVDTLNRYPQVQVQIDGYTDSVGSQKYNLGLSDRRAHIVADYLTAHGITAGRITNIQGFGKLDPIDTNKTAAGRQRNRRVEFKVDQGQEPSGM